MNYLLRILYSLIFCCLLFLWSPKPAFAAYMTSLELLRFCGSKDAQDKKLCHGYIAGIIDYHNLTRSLGTAPTINFCVPQHTTISNIVPKVMRYLVKSPQHDQFIASPAVALALFRSFPCYKNVPKPSRRKKRKK